jgi:PHD/YefM family antitoxin component YafN of YafNO toxin-antitoxin module
MSSREFNQNTGKAKALANKAPLVITDRGKPAYVLMTHSDFDRLSTQASSQMPERFLSVVDALEQKGGPEYDFDIELPRRRNEPFPDPFEGGAD